MSRYTVTVENEFGITSFDLPCDPRAEIAALKAELAAKDAEIEKMKMNTQVVTDMFEVSQKAGNELEAKLAAKELKWQTQSSDKTYWLEMHEGQTKLVRRSHPEMPEDTNTDYIDCDWAFEICPLEPPKKE